MRFRSIPFWISGFIHLAVIGVTAVLFIKPPEFAMAAGHNSVEVNLVAAAPDPVQPPPPTPQPDEMADMRPPLPDDLTVPVPPPVKPVFTPPPVPAPASLPPLPVVAVRKPHPHPTMARGDGSAPKPGKDATTASSDGGAIMDAKPDYLSNPPPAYPEVSRQQKQEGVVLLQVIVGTEGRPDSVSVRTSSGFAPLDQSAIKAVQQWRFRPASLGSMNVRSRVLIPVRFRLDD